MIGVFFMKFCQNCGISLDDNAKFCIGCGAVVEANPTYSAPVDYSDVQLISQNTVLNTVRECAKSKLFLVAIILYSITLVLSLITSVSSVSLANGLLDSYMDMMVGDALSDEIMASSYSVGSVIGIVIGMAPTVLFAVGMWITYASAVSQNDRMSTAGLTIIKVVSIIYLVLMCIAAGLMVIVFALLLIFFNAIDFGALIHSDVWRDYGMSSGDVAVAQSMFSVVLIVALVVVAIVFALIIIYYAKIIKTINVIKSTITTGAVTGKISVFVAVMTIILGGCTALSITSVLVLGQFLPAISSILSALSSIFFGVVLFSYRNKIASVSN